VRRVIVTVLELAAATADRPAISSCPCCDSSITRRCNAGI